MDLFSGLGGNAYAFRGFATPQLYCEILPSARLILKSAMLQGHIPTAPIHADVTTLMRSEVYRTAKEKRPMLISGSWPCQGNSTMGKRKGMADPRSGLIRELCDIYEDARPDIFFCENTPSVVDNGQLAYLRERLGKMYSISWGTFTAEDCGFPHVRRRFFAVGVLKGQSVALPAAEPLSRLLPAGEEPPRMTLEPQFGRVARLHALGNSVVPAAILHGFHTLLKMDVPEPRPARPLRLEIAAHFYTPPEGVTPSKLFNSDGLVVDAVRKTRWSTPRAGMHGACHVLTERSIRDLPTMLRFERGTPDELRGGQMSVSWNEWLMVRRGLFFWFLWLTHTRRRATRWATLRSPTLRSWRSSKRRRARAADTHAASHARGCTMTTTTCRSGSGALQTTISRLWSPRN
jgi:DNA (cytosine-5)-methyltransferase 1